MGLIFLRDQSAIGATTIYFNDTATGANNRTSWADVYTRIGAAVAAITADTSSPAMSFVVNSTMIFVVSSAGTWTLR